MLLETINLIIGKQTYPQKQINLNDIKNIELSYESKLFFFILP